MTITFDHAIDDTVHIIPINAPGRVIALLVASRGPEYKVAYWIAGERKEEWLQSSEMKVQGT